MPPMPENPLALIIEDDPNLAFIFSKSLEYAEFRTETIRDGGAALVRLKEVVPHIIVLDLHLPTVSGREILNHIRTDARLAKAHVILATADPLQANELQDDVDIVLVKPISFNQLRDLAARLRG